MANMRGSSRTRRLARAHTTFATSWPRIFFGMKRQAPDEAEDPPVAKEAKVDSEPQATELPSTLPEEAIPSPITEPAASEAPVPAPFSFLNAYTLDPSSSPFQFPPPTSNGFSQLAQEASARPPEDEEGEGDFAPLSVELPAAAADSSPKFEAVEVSTGEEGESTLLTVRVKLLQLVPSVTSAVEWRERGKGQLKINQNKETHKCRLLFRTEGLHSLVLNTNLDSSCSVVAPDVHTRSLRFSCFTEAEKPTSYCVRILDAGVTYQSLYDKLTLAADETNASNLKELFGVA
eukprot:TRINITY_DN3130_c0_g1_i2.p1 TRINITY_DN3130_c0_g1~~TRINITY_DN3130_c0_g1_i2.p1  ORF type:complete len:290 (-),score=22.09 TRINITY_DN3130_c0_g1_i2:178-1047(-)